MRDIAGEEHYEWLQRRRLAEAKRWRLPRPPFKAIALLLLGGALGALPFIVMGWDGKGSRSLSMERALTLGRNSATHPASLNSLNLRLFLNCRDGFKAIRKLEKKGGAYQTAATSALGRLASLILNEKLQRKNRRIPNTISYADAVARKADVGVV